MLLLARLLAPAEPAAEQAAPLRWVAQSPHCPQAAQVRDAVVDLAGRWPRRDELQVEAFLQPQEQPQEQPQQWQLSLTLVLGEKVHRQELEAESCPALARAAALIIAVSIDPVTSASVARVSIPPRTASPRVAEEPEPAPPVAEPTTAPTPTPLLHRAVPFLGGGWAVSTGATPGPSSGPALAFGLALKHSRLELMGRYVLRRTATEDSGQARIQAGVVAARGCLTSRPSNVRGLLCAGLEAGVLRADGQDVSNPRTRHFPRLAGLVRGGVRWRLSPRWALAADVEGSVSVVDAEVRVGDSLLFETPRIGVRGLFGFEIAFSRP